MPSQHITRSRNINAHIYICVYMYMYNTLYGKWIAPPLGLTEHRLGAPLAQLAATSPGTPAGLHGSKAIQSQSQSHHKTKADLESWSSSVCVCALLYCSSWIRGIAAIAYQTQELGEFPPPHWLSECTPGSWSQVSSCYLCDVSDVMELST